jgi:hypothetical protein
MFIIQFHRLQSQLSNIKISQELDFTEILSNNQLYLYICKQIHFQKINEFCDEYHSQIKQLGKGIHQKR